jgi:hypothetical protein
VSILFYKPSRVEIDFISRLVSSSVRQDISNPVAFFYTFSIMSFFLKLTVLAQIALSIYALPHWHQGRLHYETQSGALSVGASTDGEYFFEQTLDHFNRENNATFKQRYFVNETYWSKYSNAPVFFCVGGEGPPLDRTVLYSSVHCNDMVEIAPKHGALLVALEHRYYGPSNPFGKDFSTSNLQWLSTEQALGDIATFHALLSSKYALTATHKWITWP